jgi:regulator of sigma E protease
MIEAIQNILTYAFAFVLVLSVVVFVHEFGHFQAARWRKIAVDTFSIGFGNALASWRDKQGVAWKIGSLPLGGYVKFKGDADEVSSHAIDGARTPEELAAARAAGLFHAQKVSDRAIVVAAGPITNFVFSTLVFALLFMIVGKNFTDPGAAAPRIGDVVKDSAAAAAGLRPGDLVLTIDGVEIKDWTALQTTVRAAPERPLTVRILRDGASQTVTITPKSTSWTDPETGIDKKIGLFGVARPPLTDAEIDIRKLGPIEALTAGASEVWNTIAHTLTYLGNIITGKAKADHLAGPLGIMDQSGQVLQASWGDGEAQKTIWERVGSAFAGLAWWAAILSVAVGFVNLLPVPMLDGGHLMFYSVEAVRGRPLSARVQELGFRVGFVMLISLFLFATWNDVQRLFLS